jgi:hypothetical protein
MFWDEILPSFSITNSIMTFPVIFASLASLGYLEVP